MSLHITPEMAESPAKRRFRKTYHRAYYLKNKEDLNKKINERRAKIKQTKEGWARYALYSLRTRSNKTGVECTVTAKDLILPDYCPVLGIKLATNTNKRAMKAYDSPSIDRFDNTKGYIPGNIRVISNRANILKRDATLEEMKAIVKYMEGG